MKRREFLVGAAAAVGLASTRRGWAQARDPSTLREPQGRPEQGRGATGSGSSRASSRDEEAACARKVVTSLATRAFRHPATSADVQSLMEFYQDGRKQGGDFDRGIELTLARILADPKFIYRIETEPATLKGGQSYRLSDVDLASRLSFFLWSSIPDEELLTAASQGRLK